MIAPRLSAPGREAEKSPYIQRIAFGATHRGLDALKKTATTIIRRQSGKMDMDISALRQLNLICSKALIEVEGIPTSDFLSSVVTPWKQHLEKFQDTVKSLETFPWADDHPEQRLKKEQMQVRIDEALAEAKEVRDIYKNLDALASDTYGRLISPIDDIIEGQIERESERERQRRHWSDKTSVLQAVAKDGLGLARATDQLRADREVVRAAVAANRGALKFCGDMELRLQLESSADALEAFCAAEPLYAALRDGSLTAVRVAVRQGQSFDAKDERGCTYRSIIADARATAVDILDFAGIVICESKGSWSVERMISRSCSNLIWLDVRCCGLEVVPEIVRTLTALQTLKLGDNPLSELPLFLTELAHLKELDLSGIPALDTVARIGEEKGVAGVFDYLRDLHDDPQPSFALKLVMAGPSMAGKSSLLNALRLGEPRLTDPETGRTIGLDIKRLVIRDPRAPRGLYFLCYDAGGHDEYQEMHQIFLSPNTLYLLVWNVALPKPGDGDDVETMRQLHEKLASWANLIQAASPGATVLLVASHADQIDDVAVMLSRCEAMVNAVHNMLDEHRGAQQQELDALRASPNATTDPETMSRLKQLERLQREPLQLSRKAVAVSARSLQAGDGLSKLRRMIVEAAFDVRAFPTFGQNQPKTYHNILIELKRLHQDKSSVTWTQMQQTLAQKPDIEATAFSVMYARTELCMDAAEQKAHLHKVLDAAKDGQMREMQDLLLPDGGPPVSLSLRVINSAPPDGRDYAIIHQLAYHGADDVYEELVRLGVDFDTTLLSSTGRTAAEIATERGHNNFAILMDRDANRLSSVVTEELAANIMTVTGALGFKLGTGAFEELDSAEISADEIFTFQGVNAGTQTIDLTQRGVTVKSSKADRIFCFDLTIPGVKSPLIFDAVSIGEQRRWLDGLCRFAEDINETKRYYTFSIELCGQEIEEFTVRHSVAKKIHEQFQAEGLCPGVEFPDSIFDRARDMTRDKENVDRRGEELQGYFQQIFALRDTIESPLFKARMGFDRQTLIEKRCRINEKVANDPELLRRAMAYLRLTGEVLYHELENVPALRERVFLEPQRLVNVMKELMHHDLEEELKMNLKIAPSQSTSADEVSLLFSLGQDFVQRGVLDRRLLPWLWRKLDPPVNHDHAQINFLVDMLAQLGLITTLPSGEHGAQSAKWLLPMRLPDRNEVLVTIAARRKFASFLDEMEARSVICGTYNRAIVSTYIWPVHLPGPILLPNEE